LFWSPFQGWRVISLNWFRSLLPGLSISLLPLENFEYIRLNRGTSGLRPVSKFSNHLNCSVICSEV
jgi:hypothetical protein